MAKMTIKNGMLGMIVEDNGTFVAEQDEHVVSEKNQTQRCVPTWAELKQAADEGRLSELVKSGDRLPLVLKNGEKVDLDVGCDEIGKTFFIFHHLMNDTHYMNEYPTNFGGWRDCDMRQYLNTIIYNLLPDEGKEIIVPTPIVQVIGGEHIEVCDKLFLLSVTQIFGKVYLSKFEPEDFQIDIFKAQKNRIKTVFGEEQPKSWWLRSSSYYCSTVSGFCDVISDGSYDYDNANYSAGVTAAFCID